MTARHTLACNALQALHRTVSGVRYAPDVAQYLTVLDTPNCPYVMTWVGQSSLHSKGGGWLREDATLRVFCFVEPVGQGDIPSRTAEALEVMSALSALYVTIGNVRLLTPGDPAAEGYQMTIETGPGAQQVTCAGLRADLAFGGRAFVGFELQVPILMAWGGA